MNVLKVLLISPRDEYNGANLKFLMGGENTYTRTLLLHPPKSVQYTFYADALEKKHIEYSFLHKPLAALQKFRILPPGPSIMCFILKRKFDLIHVHGYSALLSGIKAPVILSDSSSNYLFLKDYLGWSRKRIDIQYFLKNIFVKFLSIYDQLLNKRGAPLIVWSEFAKRHHARYVHYNEKITVIPPGIPKPPIKKVIHLSCDILFIGTDFERKGGELLIKAYSYLKKKYPQIRLSLISNVSRNAKLPKDVYQEPYVPRDKLLGTIYPKADILVLVPPVAEGYGLVVVEAASFGIPAIVSSVYALPELVEDGKTGFVVKTGSVEELVRALEKLITNKTLREKMGEAARERFLERFSVEATNKKLLKVYKDAVRKS